MHPPSASEWAAGRKVILVVAVVALAFLGSYQFAYPILLGNDGYFHSALCRRILSHGFERSGLGWMPLTRVGNAWVDHEVLWHLAAIPFVHSSPLVGAQVFSCLQIAAVPVTLAWIMVAWRVPLVSLLALAPLMGSGGLLFRLSAFRPQTISVVLLLWGLWAVAERRQRFLIGIAALFAASHGSFPLLVGLAALAGVTQRVLEQSATEDYEVSAWAPLGAALQGTLLGLVVNPYFPGNLGFMIWHLGLATSETASGLEWTPFTLESLLHLTGPALAVIATVLIAALGLRLWQRWRHGPLPVGGPRTRHREPPGTSAFLFLATAALLILGARHRRMVDYWLPVTTLWAGIFLRDSAGGTVPTWSSKLQLVLGLVGGVALGSSFLKIQGESDFRGQSESIERFATMARALEAREAQEVARSRPTPTRDTVFDQRLYHSSWAQFSHLTFVLPSMSFITGLDPAFLRSARPDLDGLMAGLGAGRIPCPSLPIGLAFGARWVLVNTDADPGLDQQARIDPLLEPVWNQSGLALYRLRAQPKLPLEVQGSWLVPGAVSHGGRIDPTGGLTFESAGKGGYVELPLPLIAAGRLMLHMEATTTPPDATVEVTLNGRPVVESVTARAMADAHLLPVVGQGGAVLRITVTSPATQPAKLTVTAIRLSEGSPATPPQERTRGP